jgi:hypothetical protein
MRKCILEVFNCGLCCFVDLRFDVGGSIIEVLAFNEDSAMDALRNAIKGQVPSSSTPLPVATVRNQKGLRSLTIEHLEQATRIGRIFEIDLMSAPPGRWRNE